MIYYISGSELSDEETTTYYVLLVDNDPITFKKAIKETKW
jgi:hypothetical protein